MMVRRLPAHLPRLERTGLKRSSGCACQTPGPGRSISHQEDWAQSPTPAHSRIWLTRVIFKEPQRDKWTHQYFQAKSFNGSMETVSLWISNQTGPQPQGIGRLIFVRGRREGEWKIHTPAGLSTPSLQQRSTQYSCPIPRERSAWKPGSREVSHPFWLSALTESACPDAGTTEAETEARQPSHTHQGKEEMGVTGMQGREEDPGC